MKAEEREGAKKFERVLKMTRMEMLSLYSFVTYLQAKDPDTNHWILGRLTRALFKFYETDDCEGSHNETASKCPCCGKNHDNDKKD